MHLIITDAWMAKSRPMHLTGIKLLLVGLGTSLTLTLTAAALYHWVFVKGAREGWPIISSVVKLVAHDEFEQRDKFLRENLDVMAQKVGEMQAKLLQMQTLTERVSGLAGIPAAEIKSKITVGGSGGPLVLGRSLSLTDVQQAVDQLQALSDQQSDLLTVAESRFFEQKIKAMAIPTQLPVLTSLIGSSFGWRIDPITGMRAMHTGLDFPAEVGAPIFAAAGGLVVTQEAHPEYGNMIEVDHGNQVISRYAHASKVFVKKGDLIKRGQKIALVGATGRATGPHLHYEVLVQGAPQDPRKFLNAGIGLAKK
ncbi:MAG: M23 family metallopeptidase [Cytophagales bacterium]|nr:M23 family metallopeptidase [Cytophagales bacterium]